MRRRQTKIIVTMGPATDDWEVLEGIVNAGADVFRINMSHGTPQDQMNRARQVREVAAEQGREVAVLVDLQGPKIRVESFRDEGVDLESGDTFVLDAGPDPELGTREVVGVTYKGLPDDVSPDDVLLLDDGMIAMRVTEVRDRKVICRVESGGRLSSRKGINLKGGGLSIPGIAGRDRADIQRAAQMEADYLAVSFPRNAADMEEAERLLRAAGSHAHVVAKIERMEAIHNLEEIIDASHAVLVARGDLGVEIGDAELPGIQKRIIRGALDQNRIAITATQMMQSMVENPIPTRAEVLDVANAVIDGTDAVMLSAETAVGKYPVRAVEAMHRVCLGAERHVDTLRDLRHLNVRFQRIDQAIAMAAMMMAANVKVDAIIALTESGSTAQWLSRVRSSVPIYALSPNAASRRRMALYRDVYPCAFAEVHKWEDMDRMIFELITMLEQNEEISQGDRIILTMGDRLGNEGGTNTLRLVQVGAEGFKEAQTTLDLH